MFETEVAVAEFVELQHRQQQQRKRKGTADDLDHQQRLFPAAAVLGPATEGQRHRNRRKDTRRDKRGERKGAQNNRQRDPDAFQREQFGHRRTGNLLHLILQRPQQEGGRDDRNQSQYGGLRTNDAEDVRTPGAADFEHGDSLGTADERRDGNQHVVHRRDEERKGREGHQHPCDQLGRRIDARRFGDREEAIAALPCLHLLGQSVAVEKGGKLRFDLGDRRSPAKLDVTRKRVAAPPRRIQIALHQFERTEHVEPAEVLVGVGIAEKARNGQRIDSVQQYQLPHGVLTAENRMGERLGKHHLILPRQRLPGIALQDRESHHVEEHRIGVQIAGCERIVAAHDVRAVRPEQAGGGFDLRHLFGQSGCYGRIELRPVTAPLRVSVMRPQLENTVAVAEAAVRL